MTKHPRTNLLLEALSPQLRNQILALAQEVSLPTRTPLEEQDENPRHAYFLTSGIASVVVELSEGGSAEVALIGREGMIDCFSLLGSSVPPARCFIQMAGTGYRLPFAKLQNFFDESVEVRRLILQLVQQQALTMSQLAACNKLHDAEARLARWLLMVQDRVGDDFLALTQEFLGQMLGTQRTTVALAAGTLQRSGFIDYRRGKVKILSREDLQNAACDCYQVTQRLLFNLYKSEEAPPPTVNSHRKGRSSLLN
jgi:CRP-like cAMP-binding protein